MRLFVIPTQVQAKKCSPKVFSWQRVGGARSQAESAWQGEGNNGQGGNAGAGGDGGDKWGQTSSLSPVATMVAQEQGGHAGAGGDGRGQTLSLSPVIQAAPPLPARADLHPGGVGGRCRLLLPAAGLQSQ